MIKSFLKNNPIHKKIVPKLDFLFLFRPTLFFVIWIMISIGMYLAYLEIENYPQWIFSFNIKTLLFFVSISFIVGSTLIQNQISDINSDKINKKLFLLNGFISENNAKKYYLYSIIAGFSLLIFVNIYNVIIALIIFLLWDRIYNLKPFEWKKHPLLGPLCNLLVGVLLIMSGWIYTFCNGNYFFISNQAFTVNFFISILPYMLSYLAVCVITDIPDIEGDRTNNKITFAIKYGVKVTLFVSLLLVCIAFFIAFLLNDPLASTSIICSIPFFIFSFVRSLDKDILRSIRYPIFILNFFTMTIYPLLFISVIVVFYLSKYYYWHRFDLHYPTLLVDND